MQSDQSHSTEKSPLKRQKTRAIVFAVGGLIICLPMWCFLAYACFMSGWGDGSTGDAINNPLLAATLLALPFISYFVFGVVASLSSKMSTRCLSAVIGHGGMLYVLIRIVLTNLQGSLPALIVVIILSIFSYFWVKVLRPV